MSFQPTEIDALEVLVLVDNELDPISKYPDTVIATGSLGHIGLGSEHVPTDRGNDCREIRMDQICCGAHGLSLMITATVEDATRTVLFDTGPEPEVWEKNVRRLKVDLGRIDVIVLSHWHCDHSGGMVRAIEMINAARALANKKEPVVVNLHPDRPDYRGFKTSIGTIISLQADPTFNAIHEAGGNVMKNGEVHSVLDNAFTVSGEIPRQTSYELGIRPGLRFVAEEKQWIGDTLIRDERFLMCNLKDRGLVVFTGCGHAGVVNTTRHALTITEKKVPLYAVYGGFHLADADAETIENSVRDLLALGPKVLMPGHCTGWRAKYEMERRMPGGLAPSTVGMAFTFV